MLFFELQFVLFFSAIFCSGYIQPYRHHPSPSWCPPTHKFRSSLFLGSQKEENDSIAHLDGSRNPVNGNNHINWTPQTLALALPALAGMMTDPLLSMVDTLFVARLGASSLPLAALGACTSIFHLSFHCFRATTMSTSSLVAAALVRDEQKKEENEEEGQKEAALISQTSVEQALITGALVSVFLLTFGHRCLAAIGVSPPSSSPTNGQLYSSALTYLIHRSLAAPAVVMLMASEGIFRGYGDVITPWKVSCIVAMFNLILDPLLMFRGNGRWKMGLGMGIKGAAIATAFSQVCGALLYGRYLFQKRLLGGGGNANDKSLGRNGGRRAELTRQKRVIATTILRANASMMLKQGSLLLGWAYATARATRLGHTVVASHQLALSIWLVVALVLEGPAVAAQVIMAKEWEELKVLEKKAMYNNNDASDDKEQSPSVIEPEVFQKQSTIKSLSLYMIKLSLIQGLLASLAVFLLRQVAPSFILTQDPAVRRNLLTLLPHIAYQMALVSATLVTEALAIGGGRFKWLAGGTSVSSVIAMINLRGAVDLVDIWTGGIVVLFLGRLITASLAVADMNGLFRWRKSRQEKAPKVP